MPSEFGPTALWSYGGPSGVRWLDTALDFQCLVGFRMSAAHSEPKSCVEPQHSEIADAAGLFWVFITVTIFKSDPFSRFHRKYPAQLIQKTRCAAVPCAQLKIGLRCRSSPSLLVAVIVPSYLPDCDVLKSRGARQR